MKLRNLALLGALLAVAPVIPSHAQTNVDGKPASGPGASAIFGNVCTSCFFPVTIFAQPVGGSSKDVPADAAKQSICWCHHVWGIPVPGAAYGQWLPQRVIETVRTPYNSPTYGGSLMGHSNKSSLTGKLQGGQGSEGTHGAHVGFYNMHVFLFPIGKLADSIVGAGCESDESTGADLAWVSEIDPSWDSDAVSMIMTPEAAVFASMPAQLSCMVDAAAANVYQPIGAMFWCMGSWGGSYPQDGASGNMDAPRQAAYTAAKATAMLQRRAMIWKTMGDDAICHAYPNPIFTKTQYKLQQAWPNPERTSNHWIGVDPNIWGEWRYKPVVGEDFVNIEWQFVNCCLGMGTD